ncbi:MAG: hypothetical protein ACK5LY_06070 [Lachnospirales bacterium]
MTFWDWFIIIVVLVGLLGVGFYYLNRWASKRVATQNTMINSMKQNATIYVIDKKKDKIDNVNMPKAVIDQVPKYQKLLKTYFVKAKIGPQIMTLMCEKAVFEAIPLKKNIKVELAGIYIVSVVGMKSKEEMKAIKKNRKEKEKESKKNK